MAPDTNIQTLESAARAAMVESEAIAGDRQGTRSDLRHAAVALTIALLVIAALLALRVS